jgi:hypothetical protein
MAIVLISIGLMPVPDFFGTLAVTAILLMSFRVVLGT